MYLGCWKESSSGSVSSVQFTYDNNSLDICASTCIQQGNKYILERNFFFLLEITAAFLGLKERRIVNTQTTGFAFRFNETCF